MTDKIDGRLEGGRGRGRGGRYRGGKRVRNNSNGGGQKKGEGKGQGSFNNAIPAPPGAGNCAGRFAWNSHAKRNAKGQPTNYLLIGGPRTTRPCRI